MAVTCNECNFHLLPKYLFSRNCLNKNHNGCNLKQNMNDNKKVNKPTASTVLILWKGREKNQFHFCS